VPPGAFIKTKRKPGVFEWVNYLEEPRKSNDYDVFARVYCPKTSSRQSPPGNSGNEIVFSRILAVIIGIYTTYIT